MKLQKNMKKNMNRVDSTAKNEGTTYENNEYKLNQRIRKNNTSNYYIMPGYIKDLWKKWNELRIHVHAGRNAARRCKSEQNLKIITIFIMSMNYSI